jgi:hypothetical protein
MIWRLPSVHGVLVSSLFSSTIVIFCILFHYNKTAAEKSTASEQNWNLSLQIPKQSAR